MAAGDVDVALTQPSSESCASFDGVDDDIIITNIFNNLSIQNYTISFWLKYPAVITADTFGGQHWLLGSGTTINPYLYFNLRNSNYNFRYVDAKDDKNTIYLIKSS